MTAQPRDMQKALSILQDVYGVLVERLTDSVLQEEEQLRDSQYSFAYQEVEDRYAPRIINLSHLINALQNAAGRPTTEEFRAETVISDAENLAEELNKRMRALRGSTVKSMNFAKLDDGKFLVLLVTARTVYVRPGGK